MRLLFVGTYPEPGGAACHFVSLTTALAEAGHHVAVVATPGCGIWRALEQHERISLYAATFTSRFTRAAMHTVSQAVQEVRPDWIFSVFEQDYFGAAMVATRRRVPLALVLHHAGLKRSSRFALKHLAQRYLVPSTDLGNWVRTFGVPGERISVLHNPVDTSYFAPDPERRARQRATLGLGPDDVLVGYVGRIEANKGVLTYATALSKAMDQVPTLRALWVGFGRLEPDLDAIINASPHATRHMRLPWADDVRSHYAAMDFLALPSTGRESFGRVLVEAQSFGIPVLGSDIGGIPETMDVGASGQLVRPGDVDAWATAIADMATDNARRQRMGLAARQFVSTRFDSRLIVSAFEQLFALSPDAAVTPRVASSRL